MTIVITTVVSLTIRDDSFDALETRRTRNSVFLKTSIIHVYTFTVPRLQKVKVDTSSFFLRVIK